MADWLILGHIEGIWYNEESVIVTVTEKTPTYKKKDGTRVESELLTWRVMFRNTFRKYLSDHFYQGLLVKIMGSIVPFSMTKERTVVEGYTIYGKSIEMAPYPSSTYRNEKRMLKESQMHDIGTPDAGSYNAPDF